MGQQLSKIAKRRRRKNYLERKKELAKAGVSRKARAAKPEKGAKKAPVKKATKKPVAKKVEAVVEEVVVDTAAVETAAAEAPAIEATEPVEAAAESTAE